MAADTISLPSTATLGPTLSSLIGRAVTVRDAELAEASSHSACITGYVDDDDQLTLLAGGDVAFAMYSGAALALIPRARAEETLAAGTLDDDLYEIYREVMNVLTRVVNDANNGLHLRLIPGSGVRDEQIPEESRGASFAVEIEDYGAGILSFWRV